VAAERKRLGHGCGASLARADGLTDGWKYHVTACDGLRRAPLRTTAQLPQHPSQLDCLRGNLSLSEVAAHPERRIASQREIGKYEKAHRNPSGMHPG